MKIKITQTVEIDPKAWALEYGVPLEQVREDVQSYFNGWFQQQVDQLGLQPQEKPLRIKALWSIYGPKFQHGGKRIEVSDVSSWDLAVYDLMRWLDNNGHGYSVEFYGPSAQSAKEAWDALQK